VSTKPTLPGSKPSPFPPPRTQTSQQGGLSGLSSRFGAKVNWSIVPAVDEIVCFDLSILSADVLRSLDINLRTNPVADVLSALEADPVFEQAFKDRLDESWDGYKLIGATLVYVWREDLREGMAARLNALKLPPVYLRATDPQVVLNLLARARSSLLLANAPLALERSFLERVLASDDLRLIQLVRATGFTEERLSPEEVDLPEETE
jgi:hypothetical protein